MQNWSDFQKILREIRNFHGLSQGQLATLIRCSRIHINRLENGSRKPSKFLLILIGQNLNLTKEQQNKISGFITMREYNCNEIYLDN